MKKIFLIIAFFLLNFSISSADPIFSFTWTIKSISDWDTINVYTWSNADEDFKVRLLWFDTPESYFWPEIKDYKFYWCWKSASDFAKNNLEVWLDYWFYLDDLAKEEDDYWRKLRFLNLSTWSLVWTWTYWTSILEEWLANFYQYENHIFTWSYKTIDDKNKILKKWMYNEFCVSQDSYIKENWKRTWGWEIHHIIDKTLKNKNWIYFQSWSVIFDDLKNLTWSILFLDKNNLILSNEEIWALKWSWNILIANILDISNNDENIFSEIDEIKNFWFDWIKINTSSLDENFLQEIKNYLWDYLALISSDNELDSEKINNISWKILDEKFFSKNTPEFYWAKWDWITDDTQAIKDLFANVEDWSEIIFSWNYLISKNIDLKNKEDLVLKWWWTIKQNELTFLLAFINCENIVVDNLTFTNNFPWKTWQQLDKEEKKKVEDAEENWGVYEYDSSIVNWNIWVRVLGSKNTEIKNSKFYYFASHWIFISDASEDTYVHDNELFSIWWNWISTDWNYDTLNTNIYNNKIDWVWDSFIWLHSASWALVYDNIFQKFSSDWLFDWNTWYWIDLPWTRHAEIYNNTIVWTNNWTWNRLWLNLHGYVNWMPFDVKIYDNLFTEGRWLNIGEWIWCLEKELIDVNENWYLGDSIDEFICLDWEDVFNDVEIYNNTFEENYLWIWYGWWIWNTEIHDNIFKNLNWNALDNINTDLRFTENDGSYPEKNNFKIFDNRVFSTENISDYDFPTLNIIRRNNWLNVKDFWAKWDWVTDDTASIQAAFDDLSMKSEKLTLYFPEWEYLISDTLKLWDYKTPDEQSDEFSWSRWDNIIWHWKKSILKWNWWFSTWAIIEDYWFSHSTIEWLVFDWYWKVWDWIYHKSITNFGTAMTHKNLAFFNFTNAAIRSRWSMSLTEPATAELLLDNLLFVNNHKWISIWEWISWVWIWANDYDWILENSEFINNDIWVTNTYWWQIQVKKTHFEWSRDTDLFYVNEAVLVTSSWSNMFYKDDTCNSNPMFSNMKNVHVSNWTNNTDKDFSETNSTVVPAWAVLWYWKNWNLTLSDSSFNWSPLKNIENPPFNLHNCYKTESDDKQERQSDKKIITSNLVFDSEFSQTSTGFYKWNNSDSIKIIDIPVDYSEDEKAYIDSWTRFLNTQDYTEDFIIDVTCKKWTSCESEKIFWLDSPVELSTDTYKIHWFWASKAIEEAIEIANSRAWNWIIYLPWERDYKVESIILLDKWNFTIEWESWLKTTLTYRWEWELWWDLEIWSQSVNWERISWTWAFFEINWDLNIKLKKLKILNDRTIWEWSHLTVSWDHYWLIVKKWNIILDQFKIYNIYKNWVKFENYDENSTTYFSHSSWNLDIENNKWKLFIDSHFWTMDTSWDNSDWFIWASFINPWSNVDQEDPVVFDIWWETDVVLDYVYVEWVDWPVYNLSWTWNLTVWFWMRHHMWWEDYLKLNNYSGDVNFIWTIFSKTGDQVWVNNSWNKSNYEKFSWSWNVNVNFVWWLFDNRIKTEEDKDPLNWRIFDFSDWVNVSFLNSVSEHYKKQDNVDYPYKRYLSDISNTENFNLESVKNWFREVNKLVKEDFEIDFFVRNFWNLSEEKNFFENKIIFLKKLREKISLFRENFLWKKIYLDIEENTEILDKEDQKISEINISAPEEIEKNILNGNENFPDNLKNFYEMKNNFWEKIRFSKPVKIKIPADNLKSWSKLKFLNEETWGWEILEDWWTLVEENWEKFLEFEISEIE